MDRHAFVDYDDVATVVDEENVDSLSLGLIFEVEVGCSRSSPLVRNVAFHPQGLRTDVEDNVAGNSMVLGNCLSLRLDCNNRDQRARPLALVHQVNLASAVVAVGVVDSHNMMLAN